MNFFKRNKSTQTDTLILYGTKTGNAKEVAKLTNKYLQKNGLKTLYSDIRSYPPEKLRDIRNLLVIISTHGQGTPPPSAKLFFEEILSDRMYPLPHMKYTVCALGDSNYEYFCEAGRKIDKRLKELQAQELYPRTDCDADFSATAIEWIKGSFNNLKKNI